MRVKRWTRQQHTVLGRSESGAQLLSMFQFTHQIQYSNDEERMIADGWTENGYWDSEGNRIVAPNDPYRYVTDTRSAPGT